MNKNKCAMKMTILIILIVSAILYFQSEYFSNTSLKNGLPEMVMVKGGNYQLNCGYKDTLSMRISLSDFAISKNKITIGEFAEFRKKSKYTMSGYSNDKDTTLWYKEKLNLPVVVRWIDAMAYCKWLSETTGKEYRLPTVAEWQFAARGGVLSKGYRYAGTNDINELIDKKFENGDYGRPVGQKKPNELGLYDMMGNGYEWGLDDEFSPLWDVVNSNKDSVFHNPYFYYDSPPMRPIHKMYLSFYDLHKITGVDLQDSDDDLPHNPKAFRVVSVNNVKLDTIKHPLQEAWDSQVYIYEDK